MKYYFIVPAAGLGKRMGLDIPKQYYKIRKKPKLKTNNRLNYRKSFN